MGWRLLLGDFKMIGYYYQNLDTGVEIFNVPYNFYASSFDNQNEIIFDIGVLSKRVLRIRKLRGGIKRAIVDAKVLQIEIPDEHLKQFSDLYWTDELTSAYFKAYEILELMKEDVRYKKVARFFKELPCSGLEDDSEWWKQGEEWNEKWE
jgi:hypothetical protein